MYWLQRLWHRLYVNDWQRRVGCVRAPVGWEAGRAWRASYAERHRMHTRWLRRTYTDVELLDSYGHVGPVRLLHEVCACISKLRHAIDCAHGAAL
jgi:hypothetical protein